MIRFRWSKVFCLFRKCDVYLLECSVKFREFFLFYSWGDPANMRIHEKRGMTTIFLKYIRSEVEYMFPLSFLPRDNYIAYRFPCNRDFNTIRFNFQTMERVLKFRSCCMRDVNIT